jgi:hypothetical protein
MCRNARQTDLDSRHDCFARAGCGRTLPPTKSPEEDGQAKQQRQSEWQQDDRFFHELAERENTIHDPSPVEKCVTFSAFWLTAGKPAPLSSGAININLFGRHPENNLQNGKLEARHNVQLRGVAFQDAFTSLMEASAKPESLHKPDTPRQ